MSGIHIYTIFTGSYSFFVIYTQNKGFHRLVKGGSQTMTGILMTMLYYYVCKQQDRDVLVRCFMFVTLAIRQSGCH